MIQHQRGRRNWTPKQVSYWRGKQYELEKQVERGGGDRRSNTAKIQSGKSYHFEKTEDKLAAQHYVAAKTIRNDAAYTRAVDTVTQAVGTPVREVLLNGTAKVTRQDVQKVAQLAKESPQAEQ
jgi:hypothetical protein